jgi:hypothetical protein
MTRATRFAVLVFCLLAVATASCGGSGGGSLISAASSQPMTWDQANWDEAAWQ